MTTIPPQPEDVRRLSCALDEFMTRWADKTILSKSWFEHAYAINHSLGGEPENLNVLYEAMVAQSGSMRKNTKKSFETVLAVALLRHPESSYAYLETLRHYITRPTTVALRASRLGHIKTALKYSALRNEYFEIPAQSVTHAALLFALTFQVGIRTSQNYMREFTNIAFSGEQLEESLQAISLLEKVSPNIFKNVASSYTWHFAPNNINIDQIDPLYIQLNQALLKSKEQKVEHAISGIDRHLHRLWELSCNPELSNTRPLNLQHIDASAQYLASISKETSPEKLEQGLLKSFINYCAASLYSKQSSFNNVDLVDGMTHLFKCLDRTPINWRHLAAQAMNPNKAEEAAETDLYLAAGASTLETEEGSFRLKRIMAIAALRELSTAQILKKFSKQSNILGAIYRATGNAELFNKMQPEAKRACIQHDLSL
jgi:hypothetical protein